MINRGMLMIAVYTLKEYFSSGEYIENFDSKEVADIVVSHSAAAGVAAMGAGVLPGVGALLASGIAVGAIWTMYLRIAKYLHLKLSKDAWKAIASAVLANIITQLAGVFALELAISFIPGVGILAAGAVNFGVTYIAGIIYLKALTNIFAAGKDPSSMNSQDVKAQFTKTASSVDASKIFGEAKETFQQMKKDGSLNQKGNGVEFEK